MDSLDAKINDLRSRIEIEKKCKDGAENMLQNLKDPSALQQCQLNVLESQRRLDFLSGEMTKLLAKRTNATGHAGSVEEFGGSANSIGPSAPGSATGSGDLVVGSNQSPGQAQAVNQFRDWNATADSLWTNSSTDDNLRPPSLNRYVCPPRVIRAHFGLLRTSF